MKPEYEYLLKLPTDALLTKLDNSDDDEEDAAIHEVLEKRPIQIGFGDQCPTIMVNQEKYLQRQQSVKEVVSAYKDVEKALRVVGKLLRTTESGRYMWPTEHKVTVTGLRFIVKKLREDAPDF